MYRVDIERDESGAWIATVPSVPGCHTWGRSLRAAKRRIREALSLWIPNADRAQLDFHVHLPADARRELRAARAARDRSEAAQAEAMEAAAAAARDLTYGLKLSVRDAADLIGVSHQRVQQLAAAGRKSSATRVVSSRRSSASRRVASKSSGRARSTGSPKASTR